MTSIFFEIFKEKPMAIKCITAPKMAPKVKSSRIIQVRKNADSDGTVIIVAITVPFNKISFFVSFRGFLSSFDNNLI